MYEIHVKFKDLRKQIIRKATLREAYICYGHWKQDSRIIRVSLLHALLFHMSTYHKDLIEEEDEMHTMLPGRGEGTA